MLQQAAISPELAAELAADQTSNRLAPLEKTLLARWPVANYTSVLRDPLQALEDGRADYDIFLDGAQRVLDELYQFDISALIELRYPVGGVQFDSHRFELSDLFLGQMWLAQAPMLEWLATHAPRLESLAARARPYALAQSALWLEREGAKSRAGAIDSGQLYPYLQRLFSDAFNLVGIFALKPSHRLSAGLDPLLLAGGALRLDQADASVGQAFDLLEVDVRGATFTQLRCAAELLYEAQLIDAQQYVLLSHGQHFAECVTDGVHKAADVRVRDWIDVFEQVLADLWMRGDLGASIQAVLELLKQADSAAVA
uniref:hypothetical protein n=1 Tax=Marinobacterium profundum TaxID=1714300 RepID=UPI00082A74F5|nr:hypothetical protein [Marinobacterium profundum]